jgi:NAD(P)-dependent dehydrogenase (short-subunit alcohol dehydrogenase family)
MNTLTGQTALVLGAGGNLGVAVSHALRGAGANAVLVDRDGDRLHRLWDGAGQTEDLLLIGSVDALDPKHLESVVAQTLGRFGRVDILVNAVGGFRGGSAVHETPLDIWELLLDLNLRSTLLAARAVIPTMLAQGSGKIITVGARAALGGAANLAAYAASKAAVLRLSESLAAELKGHGVNVNCVLPGTLDTEQNRRDTPTADVSRWVPPEAVADVIVFLASDAARAVHGAAIPVQGLG